jgi:predicted SAM-dependent methyltransferase
MLMRSSTHAPLRSLIGQGLGHLGLRGAARAMRSHVQTAVDRNRLKKAARQRPLRIVVGSSGVVPQGWTRTDKEYLDLLDPEGWANYFQEGTIDAILAEHVWEHLTLEQGIVAAKTCMRYLKLGGYLRIAVPDGNHPDSGYIEHVRPNGSGPGADDHKVLYDYRLLSRTISEAACEIELLEYFDQHGAFVFNPWNPHDGMIYRSSRFDERNRDGRLAYTSLIIDARAV